MNITRRGALLGASAVVAVTAVPAVSEAKPAAGEVEFFHAKMTEALDEEMRLDNAFGVALKAFRKVHPKPLVCVERLRPRERAWFEHEDDIERVIVANSRTMKCDPEYWPEKYKRLYRAFDNDPLNMELRAEYRRAADEHHRCVARQVLHQLAVAKAELQALKEKDNSLQEAAGMGALGRRIDAASDRYFKFQRLFLDSQAKTPRGLLLRVREMDGDVEEGTYGRDIYDALIRDLGRLAGEVRS